MRKVGSCTQPYAALLRARGQEQEADVAYASALTLSQGSGETETEVHAEPGRAVLATAQGRVQARGHLARAAHLPRDWRIRAILALRQGSWQARWQGHEPWVRRAATLPTFVDALAEVRRAL